MDRPIGDYASAGGFQGPSDNPVINVDTEPLRRVDVHIGDRRAFHREATRSLGGAIPKSAFASMPLNLEVVDCL
jgi:hypothetical protein